MNSKAEIQYCHMCQDARHTNLATFCIHIYRKYKTASENSYEEVQTLSKYFGINLDRYVTKSIMIFACKRCHSTLDSRLTVENTVSICDVEYYISVTHSPRFILIQSSRK
jgi:hypothetical protein